MTLKYQIFFNYKMKEKFLLFLIYLSLCHCGSKEISLSEEYIMNVFNKTQSSLEKNNVILNHLYILNDKQNKLTNDSYSILQSFTKQNASACAARSESMKLTECVINTTTLLQNFSLRCNSNIINEMKFNTRNNIFSLIFLLFQLIIIIMLISLTTCSYKNNFKLLKNEQKV